FESAPRAEIEDGLAGLEREQRRRVAAAKRGRDGIGRQPAFFSVRVEIRRNRIAAAARRRATATGLPRSVGDRSGDGAVFFADGLLNVGHDPRSSPIFANTN